MLRIGNARATLLADATAKLNVLMCEAGIDGKMLHRAHELRLERAHIPVFPLSWTLMHVLDEHSPLHGYDTARAIEADAQLFVMLDARDPTLGTTVHDIHTYKARDIRFGCSYVDVITTAEDGIPVLDLRQIGALEQDAGDYHEHGWTEREGS